MDRTGTCRSFIDVYLLCRYTSSCHLAERVTQSLCQIGVNTILYESMTAVMSADVKDALSTLCKYVNSLMHVGLTVEHLRLGKFHSADEAATEKLWSTLHTLSYYAAREKRSDVDFRDYDTLTAVKLHLAFLRYPAIRFYSLSCRSKRSRDSLIALAWLLGTQDVFEIMFRARLADGPLGVECSDVASSAAAGTSSTAELDEPASSPNIRLDNILRLNGKVNLNLREISELIREKGNLITKAHAASIGVSGLPHLCVSELALTKRIATKDDGDISEDDRRRLRDYQDVGILFNARAKWLAKRDVFFDWMITVIQEHERSTDSNPRMIEDDSRELARFTLLLRRIIGDRLGVGAMAGESMDNKYGNSISDCPSRAHRSQRNNIEEDTWLDVLNEHQNNQQQNLQRSKRLLANELKEMLKLIPSSIHI